MSLIESIQEIIKINTEFDPETVSDNTPYGTKVIEGLRFMENKAKQDGFKTKNIDDIVLVIEKGSGSKRIDVVCHIDVVKAEGEWTYPPYAAELVENRIYGRGTQDMKTQIILIYEALKQITDVPDDVTLRLVIGTDEERTMDDMRLYVQKEGLPTFAFTPDSKFPICLGEKGALNYRITKDIETDIINLKAGDLSNVVCPEVVFTTSNAEIVKPYKNHEKCVVEENDGVYSVTVKGKASHTSSPMSGDNAILTFLTIHPEKWVDSLRDSVTDYLGGQLGFESFYEPMGFMSLCLNVLRVEDNKVMGEIDIRYPNPLTKDEIENKLIHALNGYNVDRYFYEDVIETKLDNPYVQAMLKCYKDMFPFDNSEPFYSGGITYSKVFDGKCVAYGPSLPFSLQPSLAHQIDEYVLTDHLVELVHLYRNAIVEMSQI